MSTWIIVAIVVAVIALFLYVAAQWWYDFVDWADEIETRCSRHAWNYGLPESYDIYFQRQNKTLQDDMRQQLEEGQRLAVEQSRLSMEDARLASTGVEFGGYNSAPELNPMMELMIEQTIPEPPPPMDFFNF